MNKIYVDPPSGWKYGFPKIFDPDVDGILTEWLVKNGYPKKEIEFCGDHFYIRQWEVIDDRPEG